MSLKKLSYPYLVWLVLFTVVPLLLLVYYAFTNAPDSPAFTLEHIVKFGDWVYIKVLLRSLYLALICTVICLIIGYPVAYILANSKLSPVWAMLFILPMWINFLLRTYAWMSLLENSGIINMLFSLAGLPKIQLLYNSNAVLLGMVYNYLPFMILPLYTVLRKIDKSVIEAARDLGASNASVIIKVIFPLSLPGVVSGVIMVFMPSITTFVISRLLGGAHFMLFGDLIEQQFLQSGNWNFGAALSLIMISIILVMVTINSKNEESRPLV